MRDFSMRKSLVLAVLVSIFAISANAGVVRYSSKQSYRGAKKAGHYSLKAGKVAKKVLY